MEIKKRGFITRLRAASSNFDFANVIIRERTSTALKYFMILALSIGLVTSIMAYVVIRPFFMDIADELRTEIPDFEIKDGRLYSDSEVPYYNDDENIFFVLDDTGVVKFEDLKAQTTTKDIVFLSPEKMYYYSPSNSNEYDYSYDLLTIDITKDKIVEFLDKDLSLFIALIIAIITFIGKMFGTLVAWLLAGIVASFKRIRLKGGQLYSLALYALTIPSLFNVIFNLGRMRLIYYLIVVIYLVKYIDAIRSKQPKHDEINDEPFVVE